MFREVGREGVLGRLAWGLEDEKKEEASETLPPINFTPVGPGTPHLRTEKHRLFSPIGPFFLPVVPPIFLFANPH